MWLTIRRYAGTDGTVNLVDQCGSSTSGRRWAGAHCFDGPMDPVVTVTGGLVRGVERDGVNAFLGIPYAAPAVGADRYRAPGPVRPWHGTRDATAYGPSAAQAPYA